MPARRQSEPLAPGFYPIYLFLISRCRYGSTPRLNAKEENLCSGAGENVWGKQRGLRASSDKITV